MWDGCSSAGTEIVWEWECCIVNLIIILLWRNIRELVSSPPPQASDQSVDHVWPGRVGMRPGQPSVSRIDNEPGVAPADCRVDTSHTLQTPDTTLQCCSQLLQILAHTHISTASPAVQSTPGIIIQETRGHHSRDVRRLLISFPWPNWWHLPRAVTRHQASGARSLSSLSLLHHHSHHHSALRLPLNTRIPIIKHLPSSSWGWLTPACNYKIGSQDDRKSSTNQNLNRSFKRQNGTVLISPPTILSHHTIVSLW